MTLGVLTTDQVRAAYEEIDRLNIESRETIKHKEYGAIVMRCGHRIAELRDSIARSNVLAMHFLHETLAAKDIPSKASPP